MSCPPVASLLLLVSQSIQSTERLSNTACDSHVSVVIPTLNFILLAFEMLCLHPWIMLCRSSETSSRQTSMSL